MKLNEYQDAAKQTAIYPRNENFAITYTALGLASEAGEVAGKVKKMLRDAVFSRAECMKELGDVLWYVAAMAGDLGYTLEEVAEANLNKLNSRKERDQLRGSGDDR